jgi:hypothetical protein
VRLSKLREVLYLFGWPAALRVCLYDEFGIHPKGCSEGESHS